ncbi:MAG: hypothetical protein ACE5KX_01070 [Acidimicrobiia bacterium]
MASRFLIEVAHEAEEQTCARVAKAFLELGSHFVTHADWGCKDGDHRVWIIIEADDRDQAHLVIPPPFRPEANVVQLNKFTLSEIDAILSG